jgi:hypothetical protein
LPAGSLGRLLLVINILDLPHDGPHPELLSLNTYCELLDTSSASSFSSPPPRPLCHLAHIKGVEPYSCRQLLAGQCVCVFVWSDFLFHIL